MAKVGEFEEKSSAELKEHKGWLGSYLQKKNLDDTREFVESIL